MNAGRALVAAMALFALAAPAGAMAEKAKGDAQRDKPKDPDAAAAAYFTDTELIDQDGKPRRFYSDLLRGKKALINFGFTSCKGVCPTATANLAKVQKLLGDRVGREITMVTITVDPVNDTPAALKRFADKFKVGKGWYFLTGAPKNVQTVLKRIGGLAKKPEEHTSMLLVGDLKTGYWVKGMAASPPEQIVHLVDHISDERVGEL